MLTRAQNVIASQVKLRKSHYLRNRVQVYQGSAKLSSTNVVELIHENGTVEYLSARNIVLATGSRPYRPDTIDFSHPCIFDSDTILTLDRQPGIVSVYGAGVVGCEYTSIFRTLGRKVNLINTQERLLSFLDDEITDALSYHLRDQGVIIRHNESLERIEAFPDHIIIHLSSGKRILSNILLFALGRSGNSQHLGLEDIGIETDSRGYVKVNQHYQTTLKHIYAVGDLTGFPNLASSAYDQGRFAASHIVDPDCDDRMLKDIPVGIYTNPEISCVGRTESELTRDRVPYEIGHALFRHLARAQITGNTVGMLKLLFHTETLEVLGVHCFGHNAAEIVHIGQAIMSQPKPLNTLKYFTRTTFNYPTMAEAYRVAALNGLNRLCG
jgi:NAD(P) transhydrogenase